MGIGDQLRGLRVAAKLRQVDLSERLDLDQGAISKIERDKGHPSLAVLLAWIEACNGTLSIHRADVAESPVHRLAEPAYSLVLRLASALETPDARMLGAVEAAVIVCERAAIERDKSRSVAKLPE